MKNNKKLTILDHIQFLVGYWKEKITDPDKLIYQVLNQFIDWDNQLFHKEFKDYWLEGNYYWISIRVSIKNYGYIKWRTMRVYELPKSYNITGVAKEIIQGIEEVVKIWREEGISLKDEN